MDRKTIYGIVAVVAVVAIGAGAYFYYQRKQAQLAAAAKAKELALAMQRANLMVPPTTQSTEILGQSPTTGASVTTPIGNSTQSQTELTGVAITTGTSVSISGVTVNPQASPTGLSTDVLGTEQDNSNVYPSTSTANVTATQPPQTQVIPQPVTNPNPFFSLAPGYAQPAANLYGVTADARSGTAISVPFSNMQSLGFTVNDKVEIMDASTNMDGVYFVTFASPLNFNVCPPNAFCNSQFAINKTFETGLIIGNNAKIRKAL